MSQPPQKKDKSLPAVVVPSTSLTTLTPLQQYLSEINQYPLLSRDEENQWAKSLHDDSDRQAANILVTSNLRLVVKIAMDYRKNYTNVLDLIQEGNVGLIQAVSRFNPYKGAKLSTYAAWWIKAYILKFLMDNKSLVKIGSTRAQRRLFFNLRKEAEKLLQSGEAFDTKLLAETLNVREKDINDVKGRLLSADVSLENNNSNSADIQSTPPATLAIDKMIHNQELDKLKALIKSFTSSLNERDRYIFTQRLFADDPITLQDIGNHYKISRERARQIEKRIVDRFKVLLIENEITGVDAIL